MATEEGDSPTHVPLDRWRSGDESAFAVLHARFAPLLRVRVRRHRVWPMLARRLELDDVVQELWARAMPAVRTQFRSDGPGSLHAFLGRVCDRLVVDIARRLYAQKRDERAARDLGTGFDVVDGARPGRSAPVTPTGHARFAELTSIARASLSEREFEAWRLVELEQFSSDEAAFAMRCSGAAVRGLLLRARTKLVARLAATGVPPDGVDPSSPER
jgi:RNA polymerase sigma factor (sigma-70 family)